MKEKKVEEKNSRTEIEEKELRARHIHARKNFITEYFWVSLLLEPDFICVKSLMNASAVGDVFT